MASSPNPFCYSVQATNWWPGGARERRRVAIRIGRKDLAVPAETKSIRFRPLPEDWQYLGENQSEKILIVNRRQFNLGMTAAMLSLSAIPQRLGASAQLDTEEPGRPATPSGAKHSSYFFKHPIFEYVFLVSLGRAYQMAGNVGKVLYLSKQIEDGNFESAYQTFKQAGDEARALAEESASQGHKESARQAYLWAQNFYDSSTYFVDNSHDPDRFLPTWAQVP